MEHSTLQAGALLDGCILGRFRRALSLVALVIAICSLFPMSTVLAVPAEETVLELPFEESGLQRSIDGEITPSFWLDEESMTFYVPDIAKNQVLIISPDGKRSRIVLSNPIAVGAIALIGDTLYLTEYYGSTTIYKHDLTGSLTGTLVAPIPPHEDRYEGIMDIIDLNVIDGKLIVTFLNGAQLAFDGVSWSAFGVQDFRLDNPGSLLPSQSTGEWTKALRQATSFSFTLNGGKMKLEAINDLARMRVIGSASGLWYLRGRDFISQSNEYRDVVAVLGSTGGQKPWYFSHPTVHSLVVEHMQVGSQGQVYLAVRGDDSFRVIRATAGEESAYSSLWESKLALVDERVPKGPSESLIVALLLILLLFAFGARRFRSRKA